MSELVTHLNLMKLGTAYERTLILGKRFTSIIEIEGRSRYVEANPSKLGLPSLQILAMA
jgi:hypothetical protein